MTKDYDNLTEAIKASREAELQQEIASATREVNAAKIEVAKTFKGTAFDRGQEFNGRFLYGFNSLDEARLTEEAKKIREIFQKEAGLTKVGSQGTYKLQIDVENTA